MRVDLARGPRVDRSVANTARALAAHPPRPLAQMAQRPAAVIFDLDGCLWDPEMYELWGGGAPFSDNGDGTLADKSGVTVRLLGAV